MAEKKNFDSEFCGSVPLHNINLIQSYGYLLIMSNETGDIIQASENCADLFGEEIQAVVNTKLSARLSEKSNNRLADVLSKGITDRVPLSLEFNGGIPAQALLHLKKDYYILELEKSDKEDERYFTIVFQELKHSIAAIEQAGSVQKACEAAIRELKRIAGFDGVLMYRFDADWNGTVIAEEKDNRLEPYMGQTFPASDIPKQARQLYLKNPYRLIPDREYTPIRLYPVINPITNAFIDLSDCNLRSVPSVHLEYMKNMGIKASMSIRVIRNEELWGLISCHNIEPVKLNFEACAIFEMLSSVISNRVSTILNKEDFDFSSALQEKKSQIVERVYAGGDVVNGVLGDDKESVLGLFNATGAAISLNGKLEKVGKVPDNDSLENLFLWLEGKKVDRVFSSSHLSNIYDEAADYADIASGMLAIPIDRNKGEYILCFRPEMVETINWGGDPNQAITFEKDGKNYHPRNSFQLWQQKVRNNSQPWHKHELEIAESLRSFLFEFRTRQIYN